MATMPNGMFWSDAERDGCCYSMIYHEFKYLNVHSAYNNTRSSIATVQEAIKAIISKRWKDFCTPPMRVAFLLDKTQRR